MGMVDKRKKHGDEMATRLHECTQGGKENKEITGWQQEEEHEDFNQHIGPISSFRPWVQHPVSHDGKYSSE